MRAVKQIALWNTNLHKQIYILYVQDKYGKDYHAAVRTFWNWLEFKTVMYTKEPECPHKQSHPFLHT